jgi:hypothetical protein
MAPITISGKDGHICLLDCLQLFHTPPVPSTQVPQPALQVAKGVPSQRNNGAIGRSRLSITRKWWMGALFMLVSCLLIVGSISYALPGLLGGVTSSGTTITNFGKAAATITMTPSNQLLADSLVITGVTSNPDPAKLQISAHPITQDAQQQKTATATGHNQTPGKVASGRLTFFNSSSAAFTIASQTPITLANGLTVVTVGSTVVPAGNTGVTFGTGSGIGQITTVGANGNIASGTINQLCCSADNSIRVTNQSAFTGGQDPKDYRFVQQSDITGVVDPLTQPLIQQAWSSVLKQVASGEQLMAGARCTTSSNTDQPVGDKGINVPQATVTVAAKCTANTYNRQQMLDLVKSQLQKKADANLGTGYALVGNLQATAKPQTSQDGMISFVVDARGVWVYQFSDVQRLALAKEIAGKSLKDATALLYSGAQKD